MNVMESCDVNTVLKYLLGLPGPGGAAIEHGIALSCAERLCDRAHKTLSAGITPSELRAAWPKPGKRGKR